MFPSRRKRCIKSNLEMNTETDLADSAKHANATMLGVTCGVPQVPNASQLGNLFTDVNCTSILNPFSIPNLYPQPMVSKNVTFGQLHDGLQKWMVELQGAEATFHEMTNYINGVDRMVFNNTTMIEKLHLNVCQIKEEQCDIASKLDTAFFVLNQLEGGVKNMESQMETYPNTNQSATTSDRTRKKMYNQIIQLNANLHKTHELLKVMINETSCPTTGESVDPLSQIGMVLNHHYECLMTIERSVVKNGIAIANVQATRQKLRNCEIQK